VLKNDLIYMVHMPLFFFISGLLSFSGLSMARSLSQYLSFAGAKTKRLLPAYLFLALISYAIFMVTLFDFKQEHVLRAAVRNFALLIYDPMGSCMRQLWFLEALLILTLLSPLLGKLVLSTPAVYVFLSLLLMRFGMPKVFSLEFVGEYAFVFGVGIWAGKHLEQYVSLCRRLGLVSVFVSVGASVLLAHYGTAELSGFQRSLLKSGYALVMCSSLIYLFCVGILNKRLLIQIGTYALAVYLFHPLVLFPLRLVAIRIGAFGGRLFFVSFIVLAGCGVLLPLVLKKKVICGIPLLDRYSS
jgi:surface polysaccharide O-acyltransferase-like enzyme